MVRILFLGIIGISTIGCTLSQEKSTSQVPKIREVRKLVTVGEVIPENLPKTSSKWEGYYYGEFPCTNCMGVVTWLHLKRIGKTGAYVLRRKYLGLKNFYSKGGIGWLNDNKSIRLLSDNNEIFGLGFNSVTFKDKVFNTQNLLRKKLSYTGNGAVFLLDEKSFQKGLVKGKKVVKFSGITNYDYPTQDGYKSIKATYVVDCQSKKYDMSRIAHYRNTFAMGKFIYPKQSSRGESFLVHKVADKFCK